MKGFIRNLFKIGIKKSTLSKKIVEIEFQGKTQPAFLYLPYGMFSNPKNDLPTALLADQGNEESLMAMPLDLENREELEGGEVAYGVPSLKARIFFRENGHITFKIGDTEGGDFAARFLELKAGFDELKTDFNDLVTLFNSHPHTGVTTGPGSSGPPASPASPSTASIDDAKIDEIELPEL